MITTRPSLLFAAVAIALAVVDARAQELVRGPYLQQLSHQEITIRWRTDSPSNGRVSYGPVPGNPSATLASDAAVTEHEFRLTGLIPDSTYYYSVGTATDTLAGGGSEFRFRTAPAPGTTKPVRVWVVGDSGTGGDGTGRAESVRDAYLNSPIYRDPDVWLMLGDNAYDDGSEEEITKAVFQTYPSMLRRVPVWSAYGNHDAHTANGAPYFNAFTFPRMGEAGGVPSGTENYYSFDYGDIHFVCIDSQVSSHRQSGSAMIRWLEEDLAATTRKWIVAFWHHPPYSKGSHDSDSENSMVQMRTNVLPILEAHGVDLVLCGHSHSFERSMLIDGHYGLSNTFDPAVMAKATGSGREFGDGPYQKAPGPNGGTIYLVTGNGGKISGGPLNHPIMVTSQNVLGSVVLDFSDNRLDVRHLRATGEVSDEFTLLKGPQSPEILAREWRSVAPHAGTARALVITDNTFVEPRAGGIRRIEVTFDDTVLVNHPSQAVTVTGTNAAGPVELASLGIQVQGSFSDGTLAIEFADGQGSCGLPDATLWRFTLNPAAFGSTVGASVSNAAANTRTFSGLVGDITGNGRTSAIDLNRITHAGAFDPAQPNALRADINRDGVINQADRDAAWQNRAKRVDLLTVP